MLISRSVTVKVTARLSLIAKPFILAGGLFSAFVTAMCCGLLNSNLFQHGKLMFWN